VAVRDFTVEAGLSVQGNKHGLYTSTAALAYDEGALVGACYGADYIFATTEYAPFEQNQEEDFFVAGMEWMERSGADIVNVSLGYSTFDEGQNSYSYEDMDGKTAKTTIASDMAVDLGVVVVASAGNEGSGAWHYITSPADGFGVITAGAVNSSGLVVGFSGRGPTYDGRTKPDVAALGSGVSYGTSNGGYYSGGAGTSFSAPFVSSVACQILQANPSLNPTDVRNILRSTASQPNAPNNDIGWGIINAGAAVDLAKTASTSNERDDVVAQESASLDVFPNPTSDRALVNIRTNGAGQRLTVVLYDILGREVRSAEREPAASGAGTFRLELSDLTPGLYLVRAEGPNVNLVKALVVR
jgi:subtilisin family serine protease